MKTVDGDAGAAVAAAPDATPSNRANRAIDVVRAYLALMKLRVIELLLITTIPAMFLAQRGFPNVWVLVAVLVGGTMSAGSANALNCVVDADIDAVMKRTKARPLVKHQVSPRQALVFGLALGVVSFTLLWVATNWLAAVLSLAAILFYVLVYTMVLKRRTAQNIVWGGAAGCMPVLIGWAAVTGSLSWPAFVMFGVIFLWTPPHFWALAIKFKDDYARAGVPMLPVVAPPEKVARQILVYSVAMVACTLLLAPATSWVYATFAVLFGAWFLITAVRLYLGVRRGRETNPMVLFHVSNTYLMLVFVALAVDAVLHLPVLGWPGQ